MHSPEAAGAFVSHARRLMASRFGSEARVSATTSARRRLFWNSMSVWEQDHIAEAFSFELNQVENEEVRTRSERASGQHS